MTENTEKKSISAKYNELNVEKIVGHLLDYRWLLIGVTALFAVFGILYSLFATPVYQADALVQVEKNAGGALLDNLSDIMPNSQPESNTEIEIIQSRLILGRAVDDLGLETEVQEKYFPILGRGWSRLIEDKPQNIAISRFSVPAELLDKTLTLKVLDKNNFSVTSSDGDVDFTGKVGELSGKPPVSLLVSDIDAKPGTEFFITHKTRLKTINKLFGSLSVKDRGKKTDVLALTLLGDDPALTQRTLQSIADNYILQNVARKSEEAEKSLLFLENQLPTVRSSLDEAENKLNKFRQKNDSVDLSLEAKSVLDTIVSVESQLNELTFREAEISKLYTKEHPAYRALIEKRQTLEKEKARLNKRVAGMPQTQQEILRLTRDVDAGKVIYMQLLNKQQELGITKASTVGNVRIIDDAVTQPRPVAPKKILIVLFSIILGGFFAVVLVLIKVRLHHGIESPDQLEQEGISVYASIPLSEWQQKKDIQLSSSRRKIAARSDTLLANGNPADLAIEAIRSLRTSLHFAMMEAKNNILMISGASPNIGKTFVSVNLAAVIAQSGKTVLIIDADMRKGYLHSLLGIDGKQGLSDILSKQISIQGGIRKTTIDGMDMIARGQVPPNPSELLMAPGFLELATWASEHYDFVLIDTPPILAVTDAAIIGRHAGTALMICRYGVNTVKEVDVSIRRFEQNGTTIKGVILNAVERKAASYYGGYGYYHYEYTPVKNKD